MFSDIQWILEFIVKNVIHIAPAFLISVSLGVLIRFLKLDGMIRNAFNRRLGWAVLLATLVGAFSPFCSCSVVPVIASLLLGGVPLAPIMAFWIASPTMDPETFALSVATLGWPLAVARLAATLILSLAGGYITLMLTQSGMFSGSLLREKTEKAKNAPMLDRAYSLVRAPILKLTTAGKSLALANSGGSACGCSAPSVEVAAPLRERVYSPAVSPLVQFAAASGSYSLPEPNAVSCGCQESAANVSSCGCGGQPTVSDCGCSGAALANSDSQGVIDSFRAINWRKFGVQFLHQSLQMGRWMLLAYLMEALIILYVPQTTIAQWVGGDNIFAVPLAALIGIPLYLSNVTALPIVSGLLDQGMQSGAAIAFLIAGPITTLPAMAAVWGIVHKRVFALYLGIGLFGSIVLGYLVTLVLG